MKKHAAAHAALLRQRSRTLKALAACTPFVAASLVAIRRRCGKPSCRCTSGEGHPAHLLTFKEGRTPRAVYVPHEIIKEVAQWVKSYKRLKQLIRDLSGIQIAMVRLQVRLRREQRKT